MSLKTEFECPSCRKQTGESNQITAAAGYLSCVKGHRWNDSKAFMDENPQMVFKPVVPKNLPQENRTPFNIPIPIDLDRRLKEGYGEKLHATVTALLWTMIEGHAMVVPVSDVNRLAERLGKKPDNSSELVGLVYASVCQTEDAKQERDIAVKDLKAYEGMSPGRVVVDLGEQYKAVQEKARDANMPLKVWVETTFLNGIRDNWF